MLKHRLPGYAPGLKFSKSSMQGKVRMFIDVILKFRHKLTSSDDFIK